MKNRGHCTKLPQTSSCKANTGQGGAQSNGNRYLYAVHMHTDWPIAREKKVLYGISFLRNKQPSWQNYKEKIQQLSQHCR